MQILADVPAFYFQTSLNKFFDYIAASLPVINNYPRWLAGMIEQHHVALLLNHEAPKLFADALEKALQDKTQLQLLGLNARALAGQEFDRNRLSDQFALWLTTS